MKIKLQLEFEFDDGEMGGCEMKEFIERRENIFRNCANEYFEVIGDVKFKCEVRT